MCASLCRLSGDWHENPQIAQICLARPSRNQRRLILAIHRFRRCTQIKDPNATIAARGPWVPLVAEAVVPTACRQALGTGVSTNSNLPQLA